MKRPAAPTATHAAKPAWVRVYLAVLFCSWPSLALEPAVLLDADLREQAIQFMSYADGALRFFGEDRLLASLDEDKVVRIEFSRPAPPTAGGRLILSDGHEITGRFDGVDGDGKLIWATEKLGEFSISLDDIHAWTTAHALSGDAAAKLSAGSAQETGENDTVLLTNGDSLDGFVEGLTPQALRLQRGDQTLDLPWQSVHRVTLANPIVHKPGFWVTTAAGDRLRVDHAQLTGGRLSGRVLGGVFDDLEHRAIEFTHKHRLVPLGELPHKTVSGGRVFGVERPPTIGPADKSSVRLHAPIAVRYELPIGTRRFIARAAIQEQDLGWADMVLIVSDDRGELMRQRLWRSQPDARVNVVPRGPTLTLTLDEAAAGPIRDRLGLSDAAVLVEQAN